MEPNEMNTLTRAEEILQIIQSGKTDEEIRDALDAGCYESFYQKYAQILDKRSTM